MVKTSTLRVADLGLSSAFPVELFPGKVQNTTDLNFATLVVTLPGAWCYRVSTMIGWPGVCILCLQLCVCVCVNLFSFFLVQLAIIMLLFQLCTHVHRSFL